MSYDYQKMGRLIRAIRTEKGITQEVLSGLANLSRSHVAMIESGVKSPTVETLWRVAAALNMPLSALFARYEAEYPEKS